jgi:ribosomal protein S27AE
MTRADWYAQNYSGGWRTARKQSKCGQSLCLGKILAGQKYFDTNQKLAQHRTKKLCERCASEII